MSASELTNGEWVERLGARFFRPEYSMTHVLFYIDRPLLAELADVPEDLAVESLVRALVPELRPLEPRKLFDPIRRETAAWKVHGGEGPPPCLAALALAVLAATEMRREGRRPAHNYHAWFLELLQIAMPKLDADSVWHSYADSYPVMWRYLSWWLDEKHRGKLGLSTIVEDPHYTKIGFADSQTIFSSSDREKLTQFFRWIGLRPGDELPEAELLEYFRAWAGRRSDLSPGAQMMLEDEEQEPTQLARLILDAASRWGGIVRDAEGRAEARLSLTLSRPPASELGLAAPCPPGFPERVRVEYEGKVVELEAEALEGPMAVDEQRWYGSLEIPPTAGILDHGTRLVAGDNVFRLPPYSVHVLHMNRELGCWASTDQLRPSELAWLLVRNRMLDEVLGFLEQHARNEWRVVQREGVAPTGWTLIRDVIIDPLEDAAPEGLDRLAPRVSNRVGFSGGLPLPKGTNVYLTEGDPDLVLPAAPEGMDLPPVSVDGKELSLGADVRLVALTDLDLGEGSHAVRVGRIPRQYYTTRTLGNVRPPEERIVGHTLLTDGAGFRPASIDADADVTIPETGARVRGSLVEASDLTHLGTRRTPLLLPRAATRLVLIPDRPGKVEHISVPSKPAWMKRVGLECQFFEHHPSIEAGWLMVESPLRGVRLQRLTRTSSGDGQGTTEDLEEWRRVVLDCPADAASPEDRDAWSKVCSRAESAE